MTQLQAMTLLGVAIICEVSATLALKLADGFSRPAPLLVVAIGYGASLLLLSTVLRHLPVGIVYAIWAGCGVPPTVQVTVAV